MRTASILGATGIIGNITCELLKGCVERGELEVVSLTGGNNISSMVKWARELRPRSVAMQGLEAAREVAGHLHNSGIKVLSGTSGVLEASSEAADWKMAAIGGIGGLGAVLEAVRSTKTLALANKESIVCGGRVLFKLAEEHNCRIIPVDSEHNSVFRMSNLERMDKEVKKIILTASGGAVLHKSYEELGKISVQDVLRHPTWNMGKKVTVGSSTMTNKALEIIEAHHFFKLEESRIEVLIHPQSLIHAMLILRDGSMLAHISSADMKIPIAQSLQWLDSEYLFHSSSLGPLELGGIELLPLDEKKYRAPGIAREALRRGFASQIAFCVADELAIEAFLGGSISYKSIVELIENVVEGASDDNKYSFNSHEDILDYCHKTRIRVKENLVSYVV